MMSKAYRNTLPIDGRRTPHRVLHAARPVALCMGAFLACGVAAADSIQKLNGTSIDDAEIIDARWDLVQYRVGGRGARAQSIPGDQVKSIQRESKSPVLKEARAAATSGDVADAERKFSLVARNGEDWEKAEARYRLGALQMEAGDAKKAESLLKEYLSEYESEKDWWVPYALYARGTAQIDLQQVQSAEATFKKLAGMAGQWTLRAQVGQARAIEASGQEAKFLQARQMLLSVARGRSTPPELRDEAYVVRSRIYMRQKQYDEAIKELKSTFFDPTKSRDYRYNSQRAEATYLVGRAYLGLGGRENLERAELWLLRVPALYPPRGPVYTQSCKALALVYKGLGNNERAAEWARRVSE